MLEVRNCGVFVLFSVGMHIYCYCCILFMEIPFLAQAELLHGFSMTEKTAPQTLQ